MFFLMLRDKRAVNAPPDMRTIICKHEDKQVLIDYYKSMIDGENFKAGSLLADFNVPVENDPSLFADWNEEFFVTHSKKAAMDGVEFYTKQLAAAEQTGKEKWANINAESFGPAELQAQFDKAKADQAAAEAGAAAQADVEGDIPEIDPLLAAQAEPLQQEAQL